MYEKFGFEDEKLCVLCVFAVKK